MSRLQRNRRQWLSQWSNDGRYLNFSSSADSANGMDCWVHDTQSGENRLVVKNQGIGVCALSPDNRFAVVGRMASRGDNNLFLVDFRAAFIKMLQKGM